ncbi:YqgE/AlgH family protein [Vibrio sp. RC27]
MNLTNHFLVAMPSLEDSFFKRSVIYVCEHNEEGAMGIMINAPIDISIGGMLKQVEVTPLYPMEYESNLEKPVLNGGPVAEDRGFVLHRPNSHYNSSLKMTEDIAVTTSQDILAVLGTKAEPADYVVALGYAGWEAGQLEQELSQNSWLTIEADPELIYSTPMHEKWNHAIKTLGIEPAQLSVLAGHA